MVTLIYRNKSMKKGEVVADDLQFEHFNMNHSWEKQLAEAEKSKRGRDVFQLIHSPKNIGENRN